MDLPHRLAALDVLAHELFATRADLRALFPSASDPGFWIWLQTSGWREYESVRALSVPMPPPKVRRFAGSEGEDAFLATGANTYRMLWGLLARHAESTPRRVLDFGCGPGRALRFLLRHAADIALAGTDVDAAATSWCREHLPFADIRGNAELPPLAWDAATFDLVYAISVFSHLSAPSQQAWLDELHRVLRPGGLLIATVHGAHALARARRDPRSRALLAISDAELERAARELAADGFSFVPQPQGHLTTDLYGVAFVGPACIERSWNSGFTLEAHLPAALDDWQDAVVLRRR